MFELLDKMDGSMAEINRRANLPMFIASSFAEHSPHRDELYSESSLVSAYDFCTIGNLSCSIVSFASYDETPSNWAVSKYYHQLQTGACQDNLTPLKNKWANFNHRPYAPLNQNYQRCTADVFQTLLNQAGVATGNIQIIAPLCVILIFYLAHLHKQWNKVPLDESYSRGEKDSALDAYAMSMLLARDEKLKTHSFKDKESIIAQIVEELSEHTMLSDMSHKAHRQDSNASHFSTSPHGSHAVTKLTALNRFSHSSHATVAPTPQSPDTPVLGPGGKYYPIYDDEQQRAQQLDLEQQHLAEQMVADSRGGSRGGGGAMEVMEFESSNKATVTSFESSRKPTGKPLNGGW
jgi:hypothetical protein